MFNFLQPEVVCSTLQIRLEYIHKYNYQNNDIILIICRQQKLKRIKCQSTENDSSEI